MNGTTIEFQVHSARMDTFPVKATVAGQDMEVSAPGLIVELVTADEAMSQTLRIIQDAVALSATFVPGATVTASYAIIERA